jgi:hypothetical protein
MHYAARCRGNGAFVLGDGHGERCFDLRSNYSTIDKNDESWVMKELISVGGGGLDPLPPGFSIQRLIELMRRAIAVTGLDLSDMTLLTEAATGAYGVTPVIGAMAGAKRVCAVARPSRYGSVAEVRAWISELAAASGVASCVDVVEEVSIEILGRVDILTNSGHLRPLCSDLIDRLPRTAVIALMFEAWEFRPDDIDFAACVRRNIPIVGVNERYPTIDVFSFLGPLCVKQLLGCGFPVYSNRVALLCDNDFAEPMIKGLSGLGASIATFSAVKEMFRDRWDVIVVALQPAFEPRIGHGEASHLATVAPPGTTVIQFWGDINREALAAYELNIWPWEPPPLGHMGALLSEIGPEPIVRLQTGGLRAAEWIFRGGAASPNGVAQLVDSL